MKELVIEAKIDQLNNVLAFVDEQLEACDCPMKQMMQIDVAVEEIFVNIASYAYGDGTGMATIQMEITENPKAAVITFYDQGYPYDPLAKADPDITLSAEDRQIGGLGIFMVKKSMDEVRYTYQDGKNVFAMVKNI